MTILVLSILTIRYFTFSINYIIPQIDLNIYFNIKLKVLLFLIVIVLLLFKKTKRLIKKLFLLNYFFICFISWSDYFFKLQGIDFLVNNYINSSNYYDFNNINILNIFYLFIFEIFYYLWSFISFQNNLSDWSITYPKKIDLVPLSKITIFHLGVLIYYLIFKRIS